MNLDTPVNHASLGFPGFEAYPLKGDMLKGEYYLQWNDQQLKNKAFNWNGIFDAKPYISYEADANGYAFIQAPAIAKRDSERFRTNRQQRYQEFINSFSPDTSNPLKLLADIQGLYSMLEQQATRQVEQLETIDQKLISLIKVYYFEAQKGILNTGSREQHHNYIDDTRHLYQWGIRHVASTEKLLQHWIPKRIEQPYVPAPIGQSLMNGIKALMPQKERILNSMIPVIEKLIHIESLKYFALNDMPVLDDSRELPELIDKDTQKAINQAKYGKTHSFEAEQFLERYARLHSENPKIKKADAIKQIRKKMPDINVSNRTLDAWINDYRYALKTL